MSIYLSTISHLVIKRVDPCNNVQHEGTPAASARGRGERGIRDGVVQNRVTLFSETQIPADEYRYHYARTRVRVHRYVDATLALFHGPRRLARYDINGQLVIDIGKEVLALAA